MTMDIRIEWHQPDNAWYAGFLRDGAHWILAGALVGAGIWPNDAVEDLIDQASYLVVNGHNGLTPEPIALADRLWLFKQLDFYLDPYQEARYAAIRLALGHDPYISGLPTRVEEDMAVNMPPEIDPEQVVTPMTDDETYPLWDDFADQDPNNE